ncbi:hypothetical protein MMC30_008979 [Trapelia coarctata]|nr:hypothetical protein [Trapelia coarctata]
MWLARAYADFLLDLLILVLPLPIIFKLQMKFTRKLQLAFISLLGTIAARLAITYVETQENTHGNLDESNFEAPVIYWPLIEASIGIVAACLLTLRPIVEHWSIDALSSSLRSFKRRVSRSGFSDETDDALSLRSTVNGQKEPHDNFSLPNRNQALVPSSGFCQESKIHGAPGSASQEHGNVADDSIRVEKSFLALEERV